MSSTATYPNKLPDVGELVLLGKSIEEIETKLGSPLVSYSYRDLLIYLYDNDNMTTVEFKDRVAIRTNHFTERRSHPRVQPVSKIAVSIRGEEIINGTLKDISLPSAAVIHRGPTSLREGEKVKIDLVLPVRGVNTSINLNGTVFKTMAFGSEYKTVIFFSDPERSEKREIVRQYVEKRLVDIVMEVYFQNAEL